MLIEIIKCIIVGVAIGFGWLPFCLLAFMLFLGLRDAGIFLLMLSIPVGAIITWSLTRRYLRQETNRLRGAIAFSARYFFLGAAVGFFLAGVACDVAGTTFFGGLIGATVGSLGGAFQGWLWPIAPTEQVEQQGTEALNDHT